MNFLKYLWVVVLAVVLAACGGGGGSAGTTGTGTGTGTGTTGGSTVPTAADFIFELDKTTLLNTGGDKAVLTVTALDSNRNVVAGVPVSVAVDANGVFAANSGANTDVSGKFSGTITIGGDKINRTINATIKVNNVPKVASIVVTGSQIAVTPVPATPAPGQLVTLNISTADSAGSAIQNTTLVLSGSAGASGSVTTDASGNKVSTFTAPGTVGSYTVVVSGLGVSMTKIIQVVAPGAGSVVAAVGPISSSSLSAQPTSISANAPASTTNRSKLSAKFLTTGNAAIANMRVRFEIVPPALGSGEMISTGDATVYTDPSGTAEAYYIAGTRSSPTNGVVVRACFKLTDFTSASDCPQSVTASLTVAGTPLSISISDDNTMEKGLGGIAYVKKFLIQVNDSAGVAVRDAIVSASVDITHYGKGVFGGAYPLGLAAPTILNSSLALNTNTTTLLNSASTPSATTIAPWSVTIGETTRNNNVWCVNEDTNRNGFLDMGEDINGDSVIQPRKAEIIVSYVSGNRTDANGQMLVQISYGQNMGRWLAYTLRATTGVEGSEGDASKSYITDVLQADMTNGSFLTPPFGSNACNAIN